MIDSVLTRILCEKCGIPDKVVARLQSRLRVGCGPKGDCIEWTGLRIRRGYGQTSLHNRRIMAHRLAWIIANGPIPDGLCVCHRCDNPPCCNVEHLFLGTVKDNTQDMVAKGRHNWQRHTHCVNGHEFNEENTRRFHNRRICRACHRRRAIDAFHRARQKGQQ